MTTLKEDLWNALQELTNEQFKEFKWFLEMGNIPEGFSAIPVAHLKTADRLDTVNLMVQKYPFPGALKLSLKVFEKISRNDLVQHLLDLSSRLKDPEKDDSVPLKMDYERKKVELGNTKDEIKLMIRDRQMKILEIQQSEKLSSKSADRHIADSMNAFRVLKQYIEKSLADLIEAIEEKRKTAQKEAEGLIKELKHEISQLTERNAEVEQLSCIKDHHYFLQNFASVNAIPPTKNWTKVSIPPPSYGRGVGTAANQMKAKCSEDMDKLIAKAKLYRFQQFAVDVTLDLDTANPYLVLTDDGKQVYCGRTRQNLPDNPERFNPAINVLGKQSFSSGRFYYEVQVKGKTSWDLGVVRESINRKCKITANAENGFWTIGLRNGDRYRAAAVFLSVKSQPKKVGVCVDYETGSVSFYDVDTADLIHSYTDCSFNERLYPFFSPSLHHNGENSAPLIISPVDYKDQI